MKSLVCKSLVSCVLTMSHLYSVLGQLRLHGQHLSGVDVGVMSFVESFLQLLQLVGREHRPAGNSSVRPTGSSTLTFNCRNIFSLQTLCNKHSCRFTGLKCHFISSNSKTRLHFFNTIIVC